MFKRISILCIPALLLPCATLAQTPASATLSAPQATPDLAADVLGVWTTPNGKSRVCISRAQDGSFAGKIIWLKQPTYPADYKNKALVGQPKVDIHNPDKKLRSRPVLGMDVLSGFTYSPSDHDWRKGKCYDPDDGKTYTYRMWLESSDTLMVRGYVWIFHKTQEWHR
ncbi:MAG: DUF2147 domain-containing protein [Gammaproteobacteria bacterium]